MIVLDGWLHGETREVYNMISSDHIDKEKAESNNWNTMRMMREALGLPLGNDGITEFLLYWDSLTSDERQQLRRMDLSTIKSSNIPQPNKENHS